MPRLFLGGMLAAGWPCWLTARPNHPLQLLPLAQTALPTQPAAATQPLRADARLSVTVIDPKDRPADAGARAHHGRNRHAARAGGAGAAAPRRTPPLTRPSPSRARCVTSGPMLELEVNGQKPGSAIDVKSAGGAALSSNLHFRGRDDPVAVIEKRVATF